MSRVGLSCFTEKNKPNKSYFFSKRMSYKTGIFPGSHNKLNQIKYDFLGTISV